MTRCLRLLAELHQRIRIIRVASESSDTPLSITIVQSTTLSDRIKQLLSGGASFIGLLLPEHHISNDQRSLKVQL